MEEKSPRSRLRYLDAGTIADDRLDFDGLDVRNAAGEKLGEVEGFVVAADTSRPYYVVVDSGGWFSSRHYLVPVGHVRLDPDNDALRIDFDRDTIQRFPQVHIDRFDELTEEEANRFNEQMLTACCPTELGARRGEQWDYDQWSHYRQPDWWRMPASSAGMPPPPLTNRPLAEDYDPSVRTQGVTATETPTPAAYDREQVMARDRTGVDIDRTLDDRPLVAPTDRAQPGDVLGIETGGETTSLGDTAHDEDKRREAAEDAVRDTVRDTKRRD